MTISVIIAIILGWMLVNMWLTLIMLELNKEFVAGWYDLAQLFLYSVISPITVYVVFLVIYKIKECRR